MNRAMLLTVAAPILISVAWAVAQPVQPADALELVFFGPDRPYLIRFQVRIDGQPFTVAWDSYLDELFRFLDYNNDACLDKKEAESVPHVQVLRNHFRGNFVSGDNRATAAPLNQLDSGPRDGKVSRDELAYYYRKFGVGACQVNYHQRGDNRLNEAVFRQLDRDGDGTLSRNEIAAAPALLQRLDLNEDELLSPVELVPTLGVQNPPATAMMPETDSSVAYLPRDAPFVLLAPGDSSRRLTEHLMAIYDRDRDNRLGRQELGLDPARYDQLDANRDGQLDVQELGGFQTSPPDLGLLVEFGKVSKLEVIRVANKELLRWAEDGSLLFPVGDAVLDVHAVAFLPEQLSSFRTGVERQFETADTEKKGFLTRSDAEVLMLLPPFRLVDRDRDGKMTWLELKTYLDVQAKGSGSTVVLSLSDYGQMLFDLMDANRDGNLSVRELRTAGQRLAEWDRQGTGQLTQERFPRRYQVTLSLGQPETDRVPRERRQSKGYPRFEVPAVRGPTWFHKMDRNGDGDVSRREFLGSPEDFQRLDADGDGLLSSDEAKRATAAGRNQQ